MMRTSRATLVTSVIAVVASLSLAKDLLVPFALAVLLSFLLAPLVILLQRFIGRIASVVFVTTVSSALIIVVGWVVLGQATELVGKLPEYKHNIIEKIRSVRWAMSVGGGTSQAVEDISKELSAEPSAKDFVVESPLPESVVPADQAVVVVPVVPPPPPSRTATLGQWMGSLMTVLGTIAVVIVFVVFMLVYYDDHRDRILRLVGTGRLNQTMGAMDDAASRVSRYLLMQSIINASHGLVVGLGLYLLGLPAALFFALTSALLRFVPYLGPIIAAAMPIALALAVFDGWTGPLLIIAFFVILEIISNNVFEPWLYGSSTGLSPMAVIVAAVFWTWLWGGIGLILSIPLTVCLVVLGKHIAQLEFLDILLNDQPVLDPKNSFYQRLLAADHDGAMDVSEKYLEGRSLQEVYDDVILPALSLAETDRHRGELEENRAALIIESTKKMIDELGEANRVREAREDAKAEATDGQPVPVNASTSSSAPGVRVLCLPARDEADELAACMFAQILTLDGHDATCVSVTSLAGEMVDLVANKGAQIVCISALPPSAITHARYLTKRLRAQFKELSIVVGLWTTVSDLRARTERVEQDAAIRSVTTLAAGRELVRQLAQTVMLTSPVEAAQS